MVIIIGASSFIGVHTVAEFLNEGCEVLVTGRNNKFKEYYDSIGVKYVNLDLSTGEGIENLPTENVEGVILVAGLLPANSTADLYKEENAADYFRINVIGTINLLEYCRKNSIKRIISACSYSDVSKSWTDKYPITMKKQACCYSQQKQCFSFFVNRYPNNFFKLS